VQPFGTLKSYHKGNSSWWPTWCQNCSHATDHLQTSTLKYCITRNGEIPHLSLKGRLMWFFLRLMTRNCQVETYTQLTVEQLTHINLLYYGNLLVYHRLQTWSSLVQRLMKEQQELQRLPWFVVKWKISVSLYSGRHRY